jgi:hypothetical protein
MKRIVCVVIMLFLLSGCGGGGSDGGKSTLTVTPITTPTVSTTVPGTKTNIFLSPVPASDLTETINFLVNKDFADIHPELETNVRQIVADINAVLAKDPECKKRYALGKVITYANAAALDTIRTTPDYFYDNKFIGNPYVGGTTVVYWTQPDGGNLPKFFQGSTGLAGTNYINGKTYGFILIAEVTTNTILLGIDNLPKAVNGLSSYYVKLSTLLHELGHTLGLGAPEWYGLVCSDKSGTLPTLDLNFKAQFSQDPMSSSDVWKYNIQEYKFSPFNSWFISHNANHQLSVVGVMFAAHNLVQPWVKVVDTSGAPVPNATVIVYGGIWYDNTGYSDVVIAKNMETVLQTLSTDVNGMAKIINNDPWDAKGVKAYRGEKLAGAVYTSVDLEMAYFQNDEANKYTYVLELKLQ